MVENLSVAPLEVIRWQLLLTSGRHLKGDVYGRWICYLDSHEYDQVVRFTDMAPPDLGATKLRVTSGRNLTSKTPTAHAMAPTYLYLLDAK